MKIRNGYRTEVVALGNVYWPWKMSNYELRMKRNDLTWSCGELEIRAAVEQPQGEDGGKRPRTKGQGSN